MSKRTKTAEPEAQTTIVGSAVVQFRVDYERTKQFPAGKAVQSDVVSAGGHLWRIDCFPGGESEDDKDEYLSIFLTHMSKTRPVKAIFQTFLMERDGEPCATASGSILGLYEINTDEVDGDSWGFKTFVRRNSLEKNYVTERHITFLCTIMVINERPIPVPPSDIGTHLGCLLDHADGADVSFIIDGETFRAHRAVLAARSPVFRAELFGSMAEATMSSITLHDITPATFKVILRFLYTDALPGDNELGHSPVEMFQDLLAAADRYALDRLKLMCADKLWDNLTVDTVATTLACAETYSCPELKDKCFDFFAVEKNFKKAVFTDGFAMLVQKFPSITDQLRERVGA